MHRGCTGALDPSPTRPRRAASRRQGDGMNPHPLIHTELARQLTAAHDRVHARRRAPRPHDETYDLGPVVRAAGAGDPDAWKVLVERFTPVLRSVVRGYRLSAA